MKKIEVSDEMYDFLMELSREMNTQDKRFTAQPILFQICQKVDVPCREGNGNEAWHNDGSVIKTEEDLNETIIEILRDKWMEENWDFDADDGEETPDEPEFKAPTDVGEREELLEEAGWEKIWYEVQDDFENAFFTAKGCDEHIRLNGYHYNDGKSYAIHAWRNPEMEGVVEFLLGLNKSDNK